MMEQHPRAFDGFDALAEQGAPTGRSFVIAGNDGERADASQSLHRSIDSIAGAFAQTNRMHDIAEQDKLARAVTG